MCMMRKRMSNCRRFTVCVSALCSIAAVAASLTWNTIFELIFSSQIKLSPNSPAYNDWLAPTVPLFFDVYLFNWTNADRFPEEIPDLVQIGPYRFREQRRHVDVKFHDQNYSVSYKTQRSWHFDDSSNGTLQDKITMLNIIAASAVYKAQHRNSWLSGLARSSLGLSLASTGNKMSISKLVGEILFEGYEDPLLDLANFLPSSITGDAPRIDRFGLFYGKNNSVDTDGVVEVTTGELSGTLPGQMLSWNYHQSLPFYEGDCAQIKGSAGEFMPHNLKGNEPLVMFVPELCRTVSLEYQKSGNFDGLPYHEYTLTENNFDNSTKANSCFCNGECMYGGLMNVSQCRYGSPSFLSLPHFLHGDLALREKVRGMNPDPDLHSFYVAVEPRLGILLEVTGRIQYNVLVEPTPYVAMYKNVPKMIFPIFWAEQKVNVGDEVISKLKRARALSDWGETVCACAAVFFTAVITVICCLKKSDDSEIITEKSKDEEEIKSNFLWRYILMYSNCCCRLRTRESLTASAH